MDSIAMIFMTMCVTLYSSGEEDCSYLFTEVPYDQLLVMYYSAGGQNQSYSKGESKLIGFVTHTDEKIYMLAGVHLTYIEHEKKHIICKLEFEKADETNHSNCTGHFFVIDLSKYA